MRLDKWCGDFGMSYLNRNQSSDGRLYMWDRILNSLPEMPESVLEVGSNIGLNLDAIDGIIDAKLIGLEPNDLARSSIKFDTLGGTSENIALNDGEVDMAFTCGVLIHIEDIKKSCDEIYRVSSKYIVCVEYFSDTFVEIPYRGNMGMLWKQDYGKYWLDNYDLSLVDYGFFWKPVTGLDNLTFWIFEKH